MTLQQQIDVQLRCELNHLVVGHLDRRLYRPALDVTMRCATPLRVGSGHEGRT
jgi:hypothetical protein